MKRLYILILFLVSPFLIVSQSSDRLFFKSKVVNYTCPNTDLLNDEHNISVDVVTSLLKNPAYENHRINKGLTSLNVSNLVALQSSSDGYSCYKLNQFAVSYSLGDPEIDPGYKLTYYRIGTTYFMVRWYDGNHLGFTALYVFNSQYEPISIGAY